MRILDKLLPGVTLIELPRFLDSRGTFIKLFNRESFAELGFDFLPLESFYTQSRKNVLRGMHFQTHKAAHDKLVYCMSGRVLDVVVDIRPSSDYFNQPVSLELNHSDRTALLIGKGYAHGFLSLEDNSTLLYSTSTVYSKDFDSGVLWSSINFNWPIDSPILSIRDAHHPLLSDLK